MMWELYQQSQISEAQSEALRAKDHASRVEDQLSMIEDKLDAMALASQAMWELLREQTNLTDADIEQRMQDIDLRDGKRDGKMRGVCECTQCQRVFSERRQRCLYCGTDRPKTHVFQQ